MRALNLNQDGQISICFISDANLLAVIESQCETFVNDNVRKLTTTSIIHLGITTEIEICWYILSD